jgi:hypothetical protein
MSEKIVKLDLGTLMQVINNANPAPLPNGIFSGTYQAWKLGIQREISQYQKEIAENKKSESIAKRDTLMTIFHSQAFSELEGEKIQSEKDKLDNLRRQDEALVMGLLLDNEIKREKLEQEKQETRSITSENDEKIRAMKDYVNGHRQG